MSMGMLTQVVEHSEFSVKDLYCANIMVFVNLMKM